MPTAVYCFRTRPKDDKKVRRWLADHPDEVMTFCDHDINRLQLRGLMAEMDAGSFDRIVVGELADLGMTAQSLAAFLADCRSRNVTLASLRECFNLMTEDGEKLAVFLAQVAQADRKTRDDQQREGITQARAAGRSWGGRPVGTRIAVTEAVEQKINDLFDAGTSVAEIAKDEGVGVSLRTVYRVLSKRDKGRG